MVHRASSTHTHRRCASSVTWPPEKARPIFFAICLGVSDSMMGPLCGPEAVTFSVEFIFVCTPSNEGRNLAAGIAAKVSLAGEAQVAPQMSA